VLRAKFSERFPRLWPESARIQLPSSAATEGGSNFALAGLLSHRHIKPEAVQVVSLTLCATVKGRSVVTAGKYSVWFKTPIGEGAGMAEFFADGTFKGIDSSFAYTGTWNPNAERLHAKLSAWRTTPGPPSLLGVDDVDLTVTEYASDGESVMCTGFARQSPGLRMEITLMRVPDEAPGGGERAGN
jgi:hypothetical protein